MNNKQSKRVKKTKKVYDDKISQELADVLESLTHSGKPVLNLVEFEKIENICKGSSKYTTEFFNMLLEHLEEEHAEVRLSAFQVCDQMFRRSLSFRELMIPQLPDVMERLIEELPPPSRVAQKLKLTALRTFQDWSTEFGDQHFLLVMGMDHYRLKQKAVFEILDKEAKAEAEKAEEKKRLEAINAVRVNIVLEEIEVKEADIKATATSLSNCINLLLPHPEDFFITDDGQPSDTGEPAAVALSQTCESTPESDSDGEGSQDAGLREVGMLNAKHSVQVEFIPSSEVCIEENEENCDIIENTKEHAKVIVKKYLPSVKVWLKVLARSSSAPQDVKKRLTELKGEMEDLIFKYDRLTFVSAEDISSDSELEEVSDLEEPESKKECPKTEDATFWSILSKEGTEGDPACNQAVVKKEVPQPSTSSDAEVSERKQKLLAVAPKRPFDVDLYHWEDEKLPVPTLLSSSTEGHRFWVGSEDRMEELPVPEGAAALRTRVIEFTGDFTPVSHTCKVRLPSGRLCPRRDRINCPFHGEIVPRDDTGRCTNPADAIRLQALQEKRQQERPDWQNPKLLADIKKATGIDLKMPEKGKRKKKVKYPGLTDVKESQNTVTKRLERKIFKKSTMRKVASSLDKIDQRKFRDKFGDQFQYFYNS